jgi:hypothetical protein
MNSTAIATSLGGLRNHVGFAKTSGTVHRSSINKPCRLARRPEGALIAGFLVDMHLPALMSCRRPPPFSPQMPMSLPAAGSHSICTASVQLTGRWWADPEHTADLHGIQNMRLRKVSKHRNHLLRSSDSLPSNPPQMRSNTINKYLLCIFPNEPPWPSRSSLMER